MHVLYCVGWKTRLHPSWGGVLTPHHPRPIVRPWCPSVLLAKSFHFKRFSWNLLRLWTDTSELGAQRVLVHPILYDKGCKIISLHPNISISHALYCIVQHIHTRRLLGVFHLLCIWVFNKWLHPLSKIVPTFLGEYSYRKNTLNFWSWSYSKWPTSSHFEFSILSKFYVTVACALIDV